MTTAGSHMAGRPKMNAPTREAASTAPLASLVAGAALRAMTASRCWVGIDGAKSTLVLRHVENAPCSRRTSREAWSRSAANSRRNDGGYSHIAARYGRGAEPFMPAARPGLFAAAGHGARGSAAGPAQ